MAHVVAEPCYGCKHSDCVAVCPVDCFYEGEQMLYIHPDECIDCEACVPACPEEAIYHEERLPIEWRPFIDLNATMAGQSVRARREDGRRHVEQRRTESISRLRQMAMLPGETGTKT
jgi:ferredoxin